MSSHSAPSPISSSPAADGLLQTLLEVSLTGVILFEPVYAADAASIIDLAYRHLNPAAQRMLQLPQQPADTFLTLYPNAAQTGIFAFYRDTFLSGQAGRYDINYSYDGLDNYFHLAARRSGELLVVSFTDTSDQDRSAVEVALREARAAEKAALAEAEAQRQRFYKVLMALPAQVATYHGPDHVYNFVNDSYRRYFPTQALPGRALREVLPETEAQGVLAVMDRVYQTGEPSYQQELEVWLDFSGSGQPQQLFLNSFFHPLRDAQGRIDGLLDFSYDVTEQVRVRRQVEQFNQELEARVQERTWETRAARQEAEAQRAELQRVFEQAPVAIAIVRGPKFIVELANPVMGDLWGRPPAQVIGRPHFEALPDAREQGVEQIFSRVLNTGEPFSITEMPVTLAREQAGLPPQGYFNWSWQPLRDGQEQINGLIIVGVEVTGQVLARQRNEVLQAEVLAAARRQSQEREAFYQIFEQTPALIALLRTPGHRYEYVNPAYQRLFAGRRLVGLEMAEAVPEIGEQGFVALLDQVYQTGETYFGSEHLFVVPAHQGQPAYEAYFNFTYQAFQENGRIAGISIFAYEVSEQVLARQEREAQRQQLHQLFMQAPAPIVILDGPGLVYELINPAYQQLLPGRELLGKPMLEALPELSGSPIPGILDGVYRTGETFVAQEMPLMLARHTDGPLEEMYFTCTYQARRNGQGMVDGVLVFAYEVTGQVVARRKIEESGQQVRALVEGAPFPIGVLAGPEFRIQLANQAILEAWGKGPNVIGWRLAELMPELENQAIFGELAQVLSTGQPLHRRNQPLEVVMDGVLQTFYYNYSFTPLKDARGEVYAILNTAADVTDLVQARRRTEEAATELRMLTAHAPAFLFRTDAAGRVTYINEAYFEWTGLNRAHPTALEGVWEPVHPEDRPTLELQFGAAIGGTHSWESPVYRLRRHDGQYRWAFSRTQPVLGNDGRLRGHTGLTLEIHDQVELQRQLQRTNADLENFIYTASHDLKAPILNIEGLLKVLSRKVDPSRKEDETLREIFAMMEASVKRFKATIMDLTDIARIQKQFESEHEPVNLPQIVSDSLLDLNEQVKESGAEIESDLEACPMIHFPLKNLKSVVYNLLSNAIKYRSPARTPRVTLTCHEEAEYQVLLVQDNGLGMDTNNPEKIFGMFKRQHAHVEGTGVGLYIVKKMLENAGGKIKVQSTVGAGSTFKVYFKR